MNTVNEVFEDFASSVEAARTDPDYKHVMGQLFRNLLRVAGKTKKDIDFAHIASRATIDRWAAGSHIPHPAHVSNLKTYLLGTPSGHYPLASALLKPRFHPVIKFLLEEKKRLSVDQVNDLLNLAEKSQGELTREMMKIFLGISDA